MKDNVEHDVRMICGIFILVGFLGFMTTIGWRRGSWSGAILFFFLAILLTGVYTSWNSHSEHQHKDVE